MQFLAQYERNLRTATYSDYTRAMGGAALLRMKAIFDRATGGNYRLHVNCASCVLRFLKDVGAIYFRQLEEKAQEKAAISAWISTKKVKPNTDTTKKGKGGKNGKKGSNKVERS